MARIYVASFESLNLYAIDAETYKVDYKKALGALNGIAFSATAKPLIEKYKFKTLTTPAPSRLKSIRLTKMDTLWASMTTMPLCNMDFFITRRSSLTYDFPARGSLS